MNQLFGDATTAMPTPATIAERDSLMGFGSPIPPLDRQPGNLGPESAIPGLDIDPPDLTVENGKPLRSSRNEGSRASEGIGGWISKMVNRSKGEGKGNDDYRRLEQDEE